MSSSQDNGTHKRAPYHAPKTPNVGQLRHFESTASLQSNNEDDLPSRHSYLNLDFAGHGDTVQDHERQDEFEKELVPRLQRIGTRSKEYTEEEEKAVVRKLDRKLVLFLGFLYMLSFLDRSSPSISFLIRDRDSLVPRYRKCSNSRSRVLSAAHLLPI